MKNLIILIALTIGLTQVGQAQETCNKLLQEIRESRIESKRVLLKVGQTLTDEKKKQQEIMGQGSDEKQAGEQSKKYLESYGKAMLFSVGGMNYSAKNQKSIEDYGKRAENCRGRVITKHEINKELIKLEESSSELFQKATASLIRLFFNQHKLLKEMLAAGLKVTGDQLRSVIEKVKKTKDFKVEKDETTSET